MTNWLVVGLGASIGAVVRYRLTDLYKKFRPHFGHRGTILINLSGALILGWLFAMTASTDLSARGYAFLGTGICGGLTTFSTLNSEAIGQWAGKNTRETLIYLGLTYGLGLPLCALGWWLGHTFGA